MKNKMLGKYYIFVCIGLVIASFYPLYMGIKVVRDMIIDGTVMKENYPKYIIPYTPICIALLAGVLLIPIFLKKFRRFALLAGSCVSVAVFFIFEILFERKVVVESAVKLKDWQMYMCAIPPTNADLNKIVGYKKETAIDILMGNYNLAFKLHFYMISVVLILAVLNSLYGFAQLIISGDKKRFKPLCIQSLSALLFLGLCILACFTAFWRDGSLEVSPLSAFLMAVFFILLGMVGGIYTASLLVGKKREVSEIVPCVVSATLTFLMYVGEMILLHGNLYRFGKGFMFESIPFIILAPMDILIIISSAFLTLITIKLTSRNKFTCENR